MKNCKDCKWLKEHNFGPCPNYSAPTCTHPRNMIIHDYVRGQKVPWLSSRQQRSYNWFMCRLKHTCGTEGRFFEKNEQPTYTSACKNCK